MIVELLSKLITHMNLDLILSAQGRCHSESLEPATAHGAHSRRLPRCRRTPTRLQRTPVTTGRTERTNLSAFSHLSHPPPGLSSYHLTHIEANKKTLKMASQPIPPTAKARTIAHMNKDHKLDLLHMLQHFERSPKDTSLSKNEIEMVDISLDGFTVVVGHERTEREVRFRPPMKSFDERRVRLIEMTMEARKALGVVSDEQSHENSHGVGYRAPKGVELVTFVGVVLYFVAFAGVRQGWVDDGSVMAGLVGEAVAGWFRWVVGTIFVPVLAIHLFEAWLFDRTRCVPNGIKRGSRVWLLWVGNCFWEGYTTFVRFDKMAKEQKGGKKA